MSFFLACQGICKLLGPCNTEDIWNDLICPICLTGNCATRSCFVSSVRYWQTFDKIDANARGFFHLIKSLFFTIIKNDQVWSKMKPVINNVHKIG